MTLFEFDTFQCNIVHGVFDLFHAQAHIADLFSHRLRVAFNVQDALQNKVHRGEQELCVLTD